MQKYSNKFINNRDLLKNALIGFEFEFYVKDLTYYKTLELLNKLLYPVKVWGFRQYHSKFKPNDKNFKIEPDLSGGSNMIELITGPLDYEIAKYYLVKICYFIKKYGYTNNRSSIHFNISFKNKNIKDVNILKLILNMDEDEIYKFYPSRKNNLYAKSAIKLIPYKIFDYPDIPIEVVNSYIKIPESKYYGINFNNIIYGDSSRIEFRYIGGKDYEKNVGRLIYFMEKFTVILYNCINTNYNTNDIEKLYDFLHKNINKYKNISTYNNFLSNYTNITLQINKNSSYEIVSSYYNKIYDKIYEIIECIDNKNDCIINYCIENKKIEVVGANINGIDALNNYDFIDCNINGMFSKCTFVDCNIKNSDISKSIVYNCNIENSKLYNTNAEKSVLKNCYFVGGEMNSEMYGGVFRSGKIGKHGFMDKNVKIINDYNNFFNTRYDSEDKIIDDKDKKYNIKV